MTFVFMTFFLLAVLLTYTTKLVRDAKRQNKILKREKHGKEKTYKET